MSTKFLIGECEFRYSRTTQEVVCLNLVLFEKILNSVFSGQIHFSVHADQDWRNYFFSPQGKG